MTLIKEISDGGIIEFDKGLFDNWSVYLTLNNESRYALKDIHTNLIIKYPIGCCKCFLHMQGKKLRHSNSYVNIF
ncbi:MAG: hypothetical protein PHE33_05410 [Bacteroidales bacterium]|nr:hypothetical protein [Bacteroidales bacterium]